MIFTITAALLTFTLIAWIITVEMKKPAKNPVLRGFQDSELFANLGAGAFILGALFAVLTIIMLTATTTGVIQSHHGNPWNEAACEMHEPNCVGVISEYDRWFVAPWLTPVQYEQRILVE